MNPSNTKILSQIIDDVKLQHPNSPLINEIEFSLVGNRAQNEPWNLGVSMFRRVLTAFSKQTEIEPVHSIILTVTGHNDARLRIDDLKEIQKFCVHNDPVKNHENLNYEIKRRVHFTDYNEYGLRLRFNSEEFMNDEVKTRFIAELKDEKVVKFYRHAQRYSIRLPDKFGEKGYLQFDFSSVRQGKGRDFRAAQLTGPSSVAHDRYEIEIELAHVTKEELDNLTIMQNIKTRLKTYLELLLTEVNIGLPIAPASLCLKGLNSYLKATSIFNDKLKRSKKDAKNLYQSTLIDLHSYFMTVNIQTLALKHVLENKLFSNETKKSEDDTDTPYYFTDKADGIRALVFIDNEGMAFLITRPTIKQTTIIKTSNEIAEIQSANPKQMLQIFFTGIRYEDESVYNSLLDGEYLHIVVEGFKKPYFLTFDILILNSKDVTNKEFNDRFNSTDYFRQFDVKSESQFDLSIKAKTFYPYTPSIFSALMRSTPPKIVQKIASHDGIVSLTYNMDGVLSYTLDGLVFQPRTSEKSYWPVGKKTWADVYKWKPSYMATVDMRLSYDEKTNVPIISKTENALTIEGSSVTTMYAIFKAYVERRDIPSDYFCLAKIINGVPRTETEDGSLGEPIRKGSIVECRLSSETIGSHKKHWVPIKIRHDKTKANDVEIYDGILNTVENSPVTLESLSIRGGGLGGSKEIKVNKINRDISNRIIVEETMDKVDLKVTQLNLLDIGCGRMKSGTAWTELSQKISQVKLNVVGIDEADVSSINNSMHEYAKRHKVSFTSKFIHGNFNSDFKDQATVISNINLEYFDVVTCNFAIHYSMGSEETFRTFVKNVSQTLKLNGLFIGSYMNKFPILEHLKLKVKKSDVKKIVGKVTGKPKEMWSIEVKSDTTKTFGSAISVSFIDLYVEHIEYLIDMQDIALMNIFAEYGLELIEHNPFNSYNENGAIDKILSEDEMTWFSFHYMFAFKKVSNSPIAVSVPKDKKISIDKGKGADVVKAQAKAKLPAQAKAKGSTEPVAEAEVKVKVKVKVKADVKVKAKAKTAQPAPVAVNDLTSAPAPGTVEQASAVPSEAAENQTKPKKGKISLKPSSILIPKEAIPQGIVKLSSIAQAEEQTPSVVLPTVPVEEAKADVKSTVKVNVEVKSKAVQDESESETATATETAAKPKRMVFKKKQSASSS
jgi:2-polyprenyl-3-methyl-5-hydroxy-6-metoxy-1,4-benzoquinol methylase